MNNKSHKLITAFGSLITYTLHVTKYPEEFSDLVKAMNDFDELIYKSKEAVKEIDPNIWEDAFFPIAAYIDEKMLLSQWEHRNHWVSSMIQKKYYDTVDAGELFFNRLAAFADETNSVKEIYIYVLMLGFKGRYYLESKQAHLDQLMDSYKARSSEFFDHKLPDLMAHNIESRLAIKSNKMASTIKEKKIFINFGLILLVTLLIYTLYSSLQTSLEKVESNIHQELTDGTNTPDNKNLSQSSSTESKIHEALEEAEGIYQTLEKDINAITKNVEKDVAAAGKVIEKAVVLVENSMDSNLSNEDKTKADKSFEKAVYIYTLSTKDKAVKAKEAIQKRFNYSNLDVIKNPSGSYSVIRGITSDENSSKVLSAIEKNYKDAWMVKVETAEPEEKSKIIQKVTGL